MNNEGGVKNKEAKTRECTNILLLRRGGENLKREGIRKCVGRAYFQAEKKTKTGKPTTDGKRKNGKITLGKGKAPREFNGKVRQPWGNGRPNRIYVGDKTRDAGGEQRHGRHETRAKF